MKKENQTRTHFCIYCGKEIKDWERGEYTRDRKGTYHYFHYDCYKAGKGKE